MPNGSGMLSVPASGGRTAYGTVPAPIGVPPNTFTQLAGVPGFSANTAGTGAVIGSQLAGQVSPMTLNALKTGAAQFGVSSGMPGSGLETNQLFGNIAGFSEGQQQRGVQNYLAEVGALGPTMTNPALAADISARNAAMAAAPDPKLAAEQAFQDWLRGFNISRSAGNPAGPWAPGGTLGPTQGFSTTHSNWGGMGLGVPGYDDLGFSNWNLPPAPGGVYTATATPTTPNDPFANWSQLASNWTMNNQPSTKNASTYAQQLEDFYGVPPDIAGTI